jgi:hypothetical protein
VAVAFLAGTAFLRSGILFHHGTASGQAGTGMTSEYLHQTWNEVGGLRGGIDAVVRTYGPIWPIAAVGFFYAPTRLRAMFIFQILGALMLIIAYDMYRMVGLGSFVMIALSGVCFARLDRGWAALAAAASALFAICFNNHVGYQMSLIGLTLATIIVLVLGKAIRLPIDVGARLEELFKE